MKPYRMLIDSTVYLPQELIEQHDITVVSLNVTNGTETYREVDVDNEFIWAMQDQGAHWKTSQPAPGDFAQAFEQLIEEGAEMIFCVLLSQNISGTYQSALLAKNMLDDPDKVHLFDTQLAAYGTEMVAMELIEMLKQNQDKDTIIERMTRIIQQSHQMFTVENLFSLVKGGRLSIAKAAIGTVLRIKPVIEMVNGKLELVKSERTYKKIHQYFVDSIRKSLEGYTSVTFYITSQNSLDSANEVKDLLLAEFPGSKYTFTEYLGPVFSIHVGKKGYGISWFIE